MLIKEFLPDLYPKQDLDTGMQKSYCTQIIFMVYSENTKHPSSITQDIPWVKCFKIIIINLYMFFILILLFD